MDVLAERHRHLSVALRQAEDDSRARARLMAIAGHDLKQPLQVALMLIDLVIDRPDPQKDVPRLMRAGAALRRLGEQLDALAQASRAGSDFVPHALSFPVQDLLVHLVPNWLEDAEAKGVSLIVVESRLIVESDVAMLSTIVGNLVGNAIKYTAAGGRVLVGCRRRGRNVSLEVLDTGRGIPADKLAVIFEEFERVDPGEPLQGLGLGLSIVRRTADALGLKLFVTSEVGKGSSFRIDMPGARG